MLNLKLFGIEFQNYLIALINDLFIIFIIVAEKPEKSMTKKPQKEFDPDRLVLTKQEILEFCDGVLKRWDKKPIENAQNIFAMNAVRMSVQWTDEDSLKAIWGEILKWAFALMYKNAIAQAKEENMDWSHVMVSLGITAENKLRRSSQKD